MIDIMFSVQFALQLHKTVPHLGGNSFDIRMSHTNLIVDSHVLHNILIGKSSFFLSNDHIF